jgi:hypothetical protein
MSETNKKINSTTKKTKKKIFKPKAVLPKEEKQQDKLKDSFLEKIGDVWDAEVDKIKSLGAFYKNVSGYVHYVNDLSLQFSINECKDLSLVDEVLIKKSKDLANSIQKNLVVQLTRDDYEVESKKPFNIRR